MKVKKLFRIFLVSILFISACFVLPSKALASIEDFSLYAQIDPDENITVTSTRVTFDHLTRNESAFVYKDKGYGYFAYNFEVDFEWYFADGTGASGLQSIWTVSNVVNDRNSLYTADDDYLTVYSRPYGSSPDTYEKLTLEECDSGTVYTDVSSYSGHTMGTSNYIKIVRDEDVGTYGTLYCYIYSDAAMTTLEDTLSLTLHSKKDFRYIYALQSNNTGEDSLWESGYIQNVDISLTTPLIPTVMTVYSQTISTGIILGGYAGNENGAITEKHFEYGIESGNYTDNISGTFVTGGETWFTAILTDDDITAGQTYYFRAVASNANGTGYGQELSFLAVFSSISIVTGGVELQEQPNGKFSAVMNYRVSPPTVDNLYLLLSTSANMSDPITDVVYSGSTIMGSNTVSYEFSTYNITTGYGILDPETTYYYQGHIDYNSIDYYGDIKSFTTGNLTITIPDKPVVTITSLKDVSADYNGTYFFEIVATVNTTSTTDTFYTQGFSFSLQQNASLNVLLPTVYTYSANINNNVFRLVINLDNATWYTGQTLYFQAWINGIYYNKIYSKIVSATPPAGGGGSGDIIDTGGTGGTGTDMVSSFEELLDDIRTNLHLTGTMGIWAFMGLILLLVALVFGIGMAVCPTGIAKAAVGVAWLLSSICVVGAFMFTGQLGIWPILILVGGVVALIIIVLSVRLSGGGTING